jgi:hypothetical protein
MPRKRVEVGIDWDSAKADIVSFAEQLLVDVDGKPLRLHPAQQEIVRGLAPITTAVTGRQFGKTVTAEVIGTYKPVVNNNWLVMCIAPSLEQSKLIWNGIRAHFERPPLSYLVKGKIKEYPFPDIALTNGSHIVARGANSPQFIRGNRTHVALIDEAAFIKDETLTDVIEPMFTVTGKQPGTLMAMWSTPFGRGAFYDYYAAATGDDPFYARFHYTSFDNPYADIARLERIRARYGEDSLLWRTEYMAEFDLDDRAVFPWADIKDAFTSWPYGDTFPVPYQEDHRYVQGVDLANLRDYFVAGVADMLKDGHVDLVKMTRAQKRGYTWYKSQVRSQVAQYHVRRNWTLVDATSLGESVVEDLADIGADGLKFTSESKWQIVQELARLLAERRLRIPNDRDIIDELRFFEYEITPSKRLKMEASQGHDDIVIALALIAHKALIPRRLGLMQPAMLFPPRRKERPRELDRDDPQPGAESLDG